MADGGDSVLVGTSFVLANVLFRMRISENDTEQTAFPPALAARLALVARLGAYLSEGGSRSVAVDKARPDVCAAGCALNFGVQPA